MIAIATVTLVVTSIACIQSLSRGSELHQVLEELRSNVQEIRSIEYGTERKTSWDSSPIPSGKGAVMAPDAKALNDIDYFYYWSNGKFRVDSKALAESFAFNGSEFQRLESESSIYSKSSTLPQIQVTPFPSPLLWSYFWAMPLGSKINLETLQADDTWVQLGNTSALSESHLSEDADKTILIVLKNDSYVYEIRLEKSGDNSLYPISWVSTLKSNGETTAEMDVLETAKIRSDDGKTFVFPVAVRVENLNGVGSTSDVRYNVDTIRINHAIADDVFEISPSAASIYDDLDKNVKDRQPLANTLSPDRSISIAITILIVIALALAVAVKRLRRTTS